MSAGLERCREGISRSEERSGNDAAAARPAHGRI